MSDVQHKFALNDAVVYTNEYGVCFGIKRIVALSYTGSGGPAYVYENMDTPWSPVEEDRLKHATDEDIAHYGDREWFQKTHGFPTTQEQRNALLDNDPFEWEP